LSFRSTFLVSVVVALAVLAAGTAYAVMSPKQYRSTGALILSPSPTDPSDLTNLLNSFERSGTMGSFVELIASDNLLVRAGNPPVDVGVRAIPDTRVIQVTTEGSRAIVTPALTAVLNAAQRNQATVRDLWDLNELESASQPEVAGAPLPFMIAATVILALLSGLFMFVVLRRAVPALMQALEADKRPRRAVVHEEDDEGRAVSLRRRAVG
jgi:phosphosulfolactate phosphohydrolase-like enzyme